MSPERECEDRLRVSDGLLSCTTTIVGIPARVLTQAMPSSASRDAQSSTGCSRIPLPRFPNYRNERCPDRRAGGSLRASNATLIISLGKPLRPGRTQGQITKNFLGSMSIVNQTLIFPIKRFRSIAVHGVETPYHQKLTNQQVQTSCTTRWCRCRVALNSDYRTSILATALTH